jgi:hypothetical protein
MKENITIKGDVKIGRQGQQVWIDTWKMLRKIRGWIMVHQSTTWML